MRPKLLVLAPAPDAELDVAAAVTGRLEIAGCVVQFADKSVTLVHAV